MSRKFEASGSNLEPSRHSPKTVAALAALALTAGEVPARAAEVAPGPIVLAQATGKDENDAMALHTELQRLLASSDWSTLAKKIKADKGLALEVSDVVSVFKAVEDLINNEVESLDDSLLEDLTEVVTAVNRYQRRTNVKVRDKTAESTSSPKMALPIARVRVYLALITTAKANPEVPMCAGLDQACLANRLDSILALPKIEDEDQAAVSVLKRELMAYATAILKTPVEQLDPKTYVTAMFIFSQGRLKAGELVRDGEINDLRSRLKTHVEGAGKFYKTVLSAADRQINFMAKFPDSIGVKWDREALGESNSEGKDLALSTLTQSLTSQATLALEAWVVSEKPEYGTFRAPRLRGDKVLDLDIVPKDQSALLNIVERAQIYGADVSVLVPRLIEIKQARLEAGLQTLRTQELSVETLALVIDNFKGLDVYRSPYGLKFNLEAEVNALIAGKIIVGAETPAQKQAVLTWFNQQVGFDLVETKN